MAEHGCPDCDVKNAIIEVYCVGVCEKAISAKQLGTPLVLEAACAICPLSRPFTLDLTKYISQVADGTLPEPPTYTQAEIRNKLKL